MALIVINAILDMFGAALLAFLPLLPLLLLLLLVLLLVWLWCLYLGMQSLALIIILFKGMGHLFKVVILIIYFMILAWLLVQLILIKLWHVILEAVVLGAIHAREQHHIVHHQVIVQATHTAIIINAQDRQYKDNIYHIHAHQGHA